MTGARLEALYPGRGPPSVAGLDPGGLVRAARPGVVGRAIWAVERSDSGRSLAVAALRLLTLQPLTNRLNTTINLTKVGWLCLLVRWSAAGKRGRQSRVRDEQSPIYGGESTSTCGGSASKLREVGHEIIHHL